MFYEHPKVETSSARVRFLEFGDSSLNVEFFSYILTLDNTEFTAVREDLLLRIMDIVENSGSSFAFPSQTLYLSRDGGIDKAKADAAVAAVHEWRSRKQLPFPDFAPGDISSFRGTITYPHPDSAVGNHK
jgi:MscS family membrane protein